MIVNPLAGKPLRYLIGAESAPAIAGCVVEAPYGEAPPPGGIWYANLYDETASGQYEPYLALTATAKQYGELVVDPNGTGWFKHIEAQLAPIRPGDIVEWDNCDGYQPAHVQEAYTRTAIAGLKVVAKNPSQVWQLAHPAVIGAIIENGAGSAIELDNLRRAAGKPDLPLRFVAFNDNDGGEAWARRVRADAVAARLVDVGVTYDASSEEYGGDVGDILLPVSAASQIPNIPNEQPMPDVAAVTGADIIAKARSYKGKFTDGPDVPMLAQAIGQKFPDLATYCTEAKNDTSWCGIFVGYVVSQFGIHPPSPDAGDVGFMWVDRWLSFGASVPVASAQPGDIAIFLGSPHHITFVAGNGKYCGGNQSDAVTETTFRTPNAVRRVMGGAALPAASPRDPSARPLLQIDAIGEDVSDLQRRLGGIVVDGEFGPDTRAAVMSYQASHGLEVDGEVGPDTWAALLGGSPVKAPLASGSLPQAAVDQIVALARKSPARTGWSNGSAPVGYINGMAVAFARVYLDLKAGASPALTMTMPLGDASRDALALYGVNAADPAGRLRKLFALMTGLGMRESSGNYSEGRDTSASNLQADTAEAGLFQQSWDSRSASPELPKLFAQWAGSSDSGLVAIFREGVNDKATVNLGSGDGATFQRLCKSKPLFAGYCAAVGLRVLRTHWGPINREEAQLRPEAEALFAQVQGIVDAIPAPPPDKPIDGEIIDPTHPGPIIPANQPLWFQLILSILEHQMVNTSGQGPDIGKVFADLRSIIGNPVVQKLLSGGAVTLDELASVPPAVLGTITGRTAQPLLPPPDPVKPAPIDPAVTPGVIVAPTPVIQKPSVQAGTLASVLAILGQIGGALPPSLGENATTNGILTTAIPILTTVLGATGIFGKAGSIIGSLITGYAASKQKTT